MAPTKFSVPVDSADTLSAPPWVSRMSPVPDVIEFTLVPFQTVSAEAPPLKRPSKKTNATLRFMLNILVHVEPRS